MKKYMISDLIMEKMEVEFDKTAWTTENTAYIESDFNGIKVCALNVRSDREREIYHCDKGRHITVYCNDMWNVNSTKREMLINILSGEIKKCSEELVECKVGKGISVAVVGLGNRKITPDSVGPMTAEKITVTRHVAVIAPENFDRMNVCRVCSCNCGVLGETGIKTQELIRGIVNSIKPNIIIAVDALATKDSKNIGAAIQISTAGIRPGAGIGNRQSVISRETIGIPVIAIGVPTVTSASTIICEALAKMGVDFHNEASSVIEEKMDCYVTLKECDIICENVSDILAKSIDKALGVI